MLNYRLPAEQHLLFGVLEGISSIALYEFSVVGSHFRLLFSEDRGRFD